MSGANSSKQAQTRELKHRVLMCLHKLADRDTHAAAASELESIARTLPADAFPSFLSSISATDSSDKSPVRRQCIRLFSVLADHHGNSLSPHLSRILSAVVRRLRDPDSSVRSACVAASLSLSSNLISAPFLSVTKPFLESLFTEQDFGAQSGAALCLAAVIEGSRNPDVGSLRKLLPRLEKLAKCEGFKAKAAILTLIGNLVGVKGVLTGGGKTVIKNLVTCLIEFLSGEDWAARKAAAETLMKMAVVEKDALWDHKASCLKNFEAKKFDKVKAVREAMNLLLEAWKEIPDLPDEISQPPESQPSFKDKASDGNHPSGSKTPQVEKSSPLNDPAKRPSQFSLLARKISADSSENRKSPPMFRKLDNKKPINSKSNIVVPVGSSVPVVQEYTPLDVGQRVLEIEEERKPFAKPGIRRALFNERHDERPELGEASALVCNETGDDFEDPRDCENLCLIRKQLVQIENQQSQLLNLLQGFIGSSQNGIDSLEARVHGIELALEEISLDLTVSNQRVSNKDALCCKFPGTEFLSSKLWRKPEDCAPVSRLPAPCGTHPLSKPGQNKEADMFPLQNQRVPFRGGRGLVMNPLAEIPRGLPEATASGVGKNRAV